MAAISLLSLGVMSDGDCDRIPAMSEVNYRRNGMKYSSFGHHKSMAPKAGQVAGDMAKDAPKTKSSRERRALKRK